MNRGLHGLILSPAPKERTPRLSNQLASMWAEGEEGQVWLKSCQQSNIKKQNQTPYHQPGEADPILEDGNLRLGLDHLS